MYNNNWRKCKEAYLFVNENDALFDIFEFGTKISKIVLDKSSAKQNCQIKPDLILTP